MSVMSGSLSRSVTLTRDGAESATFDGTSSARLSVGFEDGSVLNKQASLQDGVFAVVYTLSKERYTASSRYALAAIIVDAVQLFLFILDPSFAWQIPRDLWVWRLFSFVNLKNLVVARGYTLFIVIFYLLVAILLLSTALCGFVAYCFQANRFPAVWPIRLLRFFVSVFFSAFYVSSLSIFMTALDCLVRERAAPQLEAYPSVSCFELPHIVTFVVGAVMSILFAAVGAVMTIGDIEPNPLTLDPLATPHAKVEMRAFLLKTLITVANNLLSSYPKVQSAVMLLLSGTLLYCYLKWLPHYARHVNSVRASLYAVLLWGSSLLTALVFAGNEEAPAGMRQALTLTLFGGAFPVLLLGWLLVALRCSSLGRAVLWFSQQAQRAQRNSSSAQLQQHGTGAVQGGGAAVQEAQGKSGGGPRWLRRLAGALPFWGQHSRRLKRKMYKFRDVFEVEIASRCARRRDADDELFPEWVDVAEAILKAGVSQFPGSAFLCIAYSNFLLAVRQNGPASAAQLARARTLKPNLDERFAIFIREQEQKQRLQSESSGEASTDLVSYVEFERNFRLLLQCHKSALVATRDFWGQLLSSQVSFHALVRAFKRIEQKEKRASATYKAILSQYPKSVKVLRSYGKFLEEVKNDPRAALGYYREADRQEEARAGQHVQALAGGEGGVAIANMQVDESADAVITISTTGLIKMANATTHHMFGYKRGELEGKNVSCLMPQPFASSHVGYLQSYMAASNGGERRPESVRQMVALHKRGYVFPIRLSVTQLPGMGSEGFMGVIQRMPEPSSGATIYVMGQDPSFSITCVSRSLEDVLGYAPAQLPGRPLQALAADPLACSSLLHGALDRWEAANRVASGEEPSALASTTGGSGAGGGGEGACPPAEPAELRLRHLFGDDVRCRVTVSYAGTAGQRILMVHVLPLEAQPPLLALTPKGEVAYCNSAFARYLEYEVDEVKKKGLAQLLPPPYSQLHGRWLRNLGALERGSSAPCLAGRPVPLLRASGTVAPTQLVITRHSSTAVGGDAFMEGPGDTGGQAGAPHASPSRPRALLLVRCSPSSAQHSMEEGLTLLVGPTGVVMDAQPPTFPALGLGPSHRAGQGMGTPGPSQPRGQQLQGQKLQELLPFLAPAPLPPESKGSHGQQQQQQQGGSESLGGALLAMCVAAEEEGLTAWLADFVTQAASASSNGGAGIGSLAGLSGVVPSHVPCLLRVEAVGGRGAGAGSLSCPQGFILKLWPVAEVDGLLEIDASCVIKKCNNAGARLLGRRTEMLCGRQLQDVVEGLHPEVRMAELLLTDLGPAAGGGSRRGRKTSTAAARPHHYTAARPDGTALAVVLEAVPHPKTAGRALLRLSCLGGRAHGGGLAAVVEGGSAQPALSHTSLVAVVGWERWAAAQSAMRGAAATSQEAPGPGGEVVPGQGGVSESKAASGEGKGGVGIESLAHPATHPSQQPMQDPAPALGGAALDSSIASTEAAIAGINVALVQQEPAAKAQQQEEEAREGGEGRLFGGGTAAEPAGRRQTLSGSPGSGMSVSSGGWEDSGPGQVANHRRSEVDGTQDRTADWIAGVQRSLVGGPTVAINVRSSLDVQPSLPAGTAAGAPALPSLAGPAGAAHCEGGVVERWGNEPALAAGPPPKPVPRASSIDSHTFTLNDPGGSYEASSQTTAQEGDLRRMHRFRRIHRLVAGEAARKALRRLKVHSALVVAIVIVVHTICFALVVSLLINQKSFVKEVNWAVDTADTAVRIAAAARELQTAAQGADAVATQKVSQRLTALADELSAAHQLVYFGLMRRKLEEADKVYLFPAYKVYLFQDGVREPVRNESMGLWQLGNLYAEMARQTAYEWPQFGARLNDSHRWMFVLDNGPVRTLEACVKGIHISISLNNSNLQLLLDALGTMLGVQVGAVSLAALAYVWWLLRQVDTERLQLFSVFLALPTDAVRTLARRRIRIDKLAGGTSDSDSEDSDDDVGWAAGSRRSSEAAGKAGSKKSFAVAVDATGGGMRRRDVPRPRGQPSWAARLLGVLGSCWAHVTAYVQPGGGAKRVGNRMLVTGMAFDVYKLIMPFVLWAAMLLALYISSYNDLKQTIPLTSDLAILANTTWLTSRVRFYTHELVLATAGAASNQVTSRQLLDADVELLRRAQTILLYKNVHDSGSSGSGSVLQNMGRAQEFFSQRGCLRKDASRCYPPGHPFYVATTSGLDFMLSQYIDSAMQLMLQPASALTANNTYFKFVWEVGDRDLQEGLSGTQRAQLQTILSVAHREQIIHIVLFVAMLFCFCLALLLLFRPFLLHTRSESRRVAELLSQLPPSLDVEMLIQQVSEGRASSEDDETAVPTMSPAFASSPSRSSLLVRNPTMAQKASFSLPT